MERLEAHDASLVSKVMWRIMPFVVLMYLIAVIDRMNVSFAKLEMVRALHMSDVSYGFASSLFFLGYLLFEVPSSLAVHRFGARLWFARIVITWGAITLLIAACRTAFSFNAMRFLLGVAEAGLYPGLIYFLTLWFPRRFHVQVLGLLTLGGAFGNMLGSFVGGVFLDVERWLGGWIGISGWQWVFVATGAPAVLLGLIIWRYLPSLPQQARFLSDAEKHRLQWLIDRERLSVEHTGRFIDVLFDRRTLFFSVAYMLSLTALYGVIYWLPTVIKGFGVSGSVNGLLSGIPWGIAGLAMLMLPRLGRVSRASRPMLGMMSAIAALGVVCFVLSITVESDRARYIALAIGTPCVMLQVPCFWSFPSRFFRGAGAAASIALIGSFGSLGGFLAQNLMPWCARALGSPAGAMLVPAVCLALFGLGALWMRQRAVDLPLPSSVL
ncbi:MFS transporter [Paraburkholderia azotifigens]|uniref:MFS transporter n=1 Tax=Paraburkholderia azotifigens TaxID=2057004 RepID=UPI0031774AFA